MRRPQLNRRYKQFEKGTTVAANGTTTSTSFAALGSNNPTLTFVAQRSGRYRIWMPNVSAFNTNVGQAVYCKIANSSGGAVNTFSSEMLFEQPVAAYQVHGSLERIDTLTAGVSYTYDFNMKVSANTGQLSGGYSGYVGHCIMAMEL